MNIDLKGRSLIELFEYTDEEVAYLVDRALQVKDEKKKRIFPKRLANRTIGMIFLKPSCRTRLAFVVAANDEGAHVENLPSEDIRFGIKESVKDISRVFGRMLDGIAFRGFEQSHVEMLAEYSGVPVWNALSNKFHPTQTLADSMTLREEFGDLSKVTMAFVGDGRNNMVNSLMIAAVKQGFKIRVVAPPELHPTPETMSEIQSLVGKDLRANVEMFTDVRKGVAGCDAVYGDVWISMGEEHLIEERINLLKPYRITKDVMDMTGNSRAIYLHCLPALHDQNTEVTRTYPEILDVTDDVFEASYSRVFNQAENRMHTIKALMIETVG
ncbi:ornithine carbamoyltransferase [Roseimicrobium sp. ORNL1]|uniref:ornithine carbamoyltransferase n=1 Tax=Roseimicrobium sp. ORNL1 TaxID=2711231 RepID=UPI0013E19CE0|nr:ornithine carbamoyltransferase [Roseimicrobium sp. ORNL1]QIF00423.1 ornithine carbamoyltransferase [Roseimicrobium sp. ORNL1]